jgi:hypothetical protein
MAKRANSDVSEIAASHAVFASRPQNELRIGHSFTELTSEPI